MDMTISRSLRPSCNPESSLSKKRSRLESWSAAPELADQEVELWQQKVVKAKDAFQQLDGEIVQWHESFQATRKVLHSAQIGCTGTNNALRVESGQLLTLCENEAVAADAGRKKRVFQLKEAADELIERQASKREVAKKIERFVSENSGSAQPTVFLSINELDHPQLFHAKMAPVIADTSNNLTASDSVAMEVSSDDVKTETSALTASEESARPAGAEEDLAALLASLQESVRGGESGLRELDVFFSPERDDEDLLALDAVLKGRQSEQSAVTSHDIVTLTSVQEKLTQGVLALDGRVDLWTQHVSRVLDSHSGAQQGTATRKKKRGGDGAIPLKAGVRSHTEYDTCLLLSPLSQYPDRVLGSVHNVDTLYIKSDGEGSGASFKNLTHVPSEIVQAEDDAMERCRLQSCAAAAELKLNQLRQVSLDLRRTATDSSNALKRSEYMYLQALHEDASERRRIRKELVFYGIAPVHASDPPMSPLHHAQSASSQFNGVGVNRNAFRTSAANRSRTANSRTNGVNAANIIARGNSRYMNNGVNANPAQSSFDTSSPARVGRGANGASAAPTAPTRTSRYSTATTAVSLTAAVAPAAITFTAPVENKRRGNGRSAPAAAHQAEPVHVEEAAPANKRRGGSRR
eukprot:gene21687-27728_t